MSIREVEDIMTPKELADGLAQMMDQVQLPWRQPLRNLLDQHPEALKRYAQAHPYEAFELIKATAGDEASFSPFPGQPPMSIGDFLGQRLAGLDLTYLVKDENYRVS